MLDIVQIEGVKAKVQKVNFKYFAVAILVSAIVMISGCNGTKTSNSGTNSGGVDPNETAATVNGKEIKLEEVERVLKQQTEGSTNKMSPLELAQARLQILEGIIQQEVMFQKAEKEGAVPTDEEITVEFNKQKTGSGLSAEQFDAKMKEIGETEASARDKIKRSIAITKLTDKITGKIEAPKDKEIDEFYAGNKEAFVKKRGVKLAAIVIDPSNSGEGDKTTDEQSAVLAGNEIIKQLQAGADFAELASEKSEDQSKLQRGELGYISEEQMKQNFPPQVAAELMNPNLRVGAILPAPVQGRFFIFKLQERNEKDEDLTLDSPDVRKRVTDELINARKQLLAASYQAIAMNEAKIENFLARKVVDNPNELSGARPAQPATANANTNANAANSSANSNTNSNANSNANSADASKPTDNKNTNSKAK